MKRWITGLLLVLFMCLPALKSDAVTVQTIVGSQVNCDTALTGCQSFPSSVSILCTGATCPIRSSFSYTNTTRFWGNGATCLTSTDSGATWGACTTDPYSIATYTLETVFGASDGSVIAVATRTGPFECNITRSTNNGTSWTQVFTDGAVDCRSGGLEGQRGYCLADGKCIYIAGVNSSALYRIYKSSDNGQTWVLDSTGAAGNPVSYSGAAWNGSSGIGIPQITGGGTTKATVAVANVWTSSADWPNVGDCWGAVVNNGLENAICYGGAGYTVRSGTGALIANITLPGALALIDSGGVGYGYSTNNLYILATKPTEVGVYLSRDNLATFAQIGSFSGSVRGGNMFTTNGCIYFSTLQRFGKIC